jgi:hypothetical protein
LAIKKTHNSVRPGANDIKPITVIIKECYKQARVFVLGKPFQIRLLIMGEAKSLPLRGVPSVAPLW